MTRWYLDTSAALKLLLVEAESAADRPARIGVEHVVTYDERMAASATELGLSVLAHR